MEVTSEILILIVIYPPELIFSEKSANFTILRREVVVNLQFNFSRRAIGDPLSIDQY